MIDLILSTYRRAVMKNKADVARFETQERIMQEASEVVTERPDKGGWIRQYSVNEREKGFVQANQLDMVKSAREMARFDPNAHGVLNTMVNYIMGKGLNMTPRAEDPMVWYTWREFATAERNNWARKQFEIVWRTIRDGELFIRFFTKDEDKEATGKTTIRFIDPLLVKSETTAITAPDKSINNGVNTDPNDVEKVKSYTVEKIDKPGEFEDIPASEIQHIKINCDSDQKRGESQFLSVFKMLKSYDQWLENRIILNKMRSAIVLVKEIEGSPDEVAAIAANTPNAENTGDASQKKNFRGGTVIVAGPGVKYNMLAPNINATDVKEDGRNIKTNTASGLCIPEYILGDASNQNYASSLIAESPFVKSIQFWQIFFEHEFSKIYRRVIQNAVEAKELEAPNDAEFISKLKKVKTLSEDVPDKQATGENTDDGNTPPGTGPEDDAEGADKKKPQLSPRQAAMQELMPNGKMEIPSEIFFGCDMDWPEIIHRDLKAHADALAVAKGQGWIADSTACAALGYDYAEEVRKQRAIEEEAAMQGNNNPLLGPAPGMDNEFTMDAEMQDVLDGMDPDERDQVLRAKDPREVARVMSRKMKKKPANAGQEE